MLNKIIYTILGIGLALVFFPRPAKDLTRTATVSGVTITAPQTVPLKSSPEIAVNLAPPELTAHAALGFDLNSGTILYSNNLDEKLPIASLTKLMTAIVTVKNSDLNALAEIGKQGQVVGSSIGLVSGEVITVHNLLKALLIPSSNDAAVALANFVGQDQTQENFTELMNQEAQGLGLVDTRFSNPVGWDSDENYSNAWDLVKIVKEFLRHPELAEIVRTKSAQITDTTGKYIYELRTTNKLLLDDPEVIGIKTGFTSKALGNLIILNDHNGAMVLTIVLGSENREQDTQKLLEWIFKVYRW
jgi:D-alanyl-D-alanine carboxypeptidase